MKLQWLGTAGFQIEAGDHRFLIDPYLTRNANSKPVQSMRPHDICDAGQIFISHGHFDHLSDVPAITAMDSSNVYCSKTAAATLARKGVDKNRVHAVTEDGYTADFGGYKAQAFFSRHVKFDIPLVARTLWQIGSNGPRLLNMHLGYPKGQVLSWRFMIDGFTIHHFGTAGSTPEELERLASHPLDLLLVPLQGHTRIYDVACEYVRVLKPRMVIAHHQDDFYPPISTAVNIDPFLIKVRKQCHGTEVRTMEINETITL
ncbi:MAG: MBL fold metallo-hydrolase [Chloroflexi bacterium]|nr:MBL fold metallo-hydrolase [Chloroflexota bacterium]